MSVTLKYRKLNYLGLTALSELIRNHMASENNLQLLTTKTTSYQKKALVSTFTCIKKYLKHV